jgi:hypothetical protein
MFRTGRNPVLRQRYNVKIVPVHAMKAYRWNRSIAALIRYLDARRRLEVNITLRPHNPHGITSFPLEKDGVCGRGGVLDVMEERFYRKSVPSSLYLSLRGLRYSGNQTI